MTEQGCLSRSRIWLTFAEKLPESANFSENLDGRSQG